MRDARAVSGDKQSPSLRRDLETRLPRLYADARNQAAIELLKYREDEAARSLQSICPYTLDQILAKTGMPSRHAKPNGEYRDEPGA